MRHFRLSRCAFNFMFYVALSWSRNSFSQPGNPWELIPIMG